MPNKFYSLPKSVFEYYHAKLKDWVRAVLPTKTSDLTNDSDFLDQLALAGIVASNFSTSSTYAVGDYVLYNHTLYRCKTAISTAGAWDSSKWDATKTQDIFQGSTPGLVPAAESGDADKVLKGDGTWGEAGSSVRVSYDAQTEELHLNFYPFIWDEAIGSKTYKVKRYGNKIWMIENYNEPTTTSSALYTGDTDGSVYGRLYSYIDASAAGVTQPGWRLPTQTDWMDLAEDITGTRPVIRGYFINPEWFVSGQYWIDSWTGNNVNKSEFSILPAGVRSGDSPYNFSSRGYAAYFWGDTCTITASRENYNIQIYDLQSYSGMRSIRFCKDA